MHRPVLVTPATELPVSVDDVARLLNKMVWDGDEPEIEDAENIEFAIRSAVDHYQGWNGILGISLAVQEWRQDFDAFGHCLPLPLGPVVANGVTVEWFDDEGGEHIIDPSDYVLRIDAGGMASVSVMRDQARACTRL